jgi:hypothetical protein
MENKNNDQNLQNNMSPIAAGITGFILGVVGTAAVAMSDKNTRTKVTKKATEVKGTLEKWSKDTLHDLKTTGDEVKRKNAGEKMDEFKTQSGNPADEAKQRLEEALSDDQKRTL